MKRPSLVAGIVLSGIALGAFHYVLKPKPSERDWCKAVFSWLNQKGPITLTREQVFERMGLMESDEP